ncbi:MAG: TetR/AcrR family transcriptional regulator [Spirochaetota bacterium]
MPVKQTFEHLSEEKRSVIINACIEVFGEHGYDRSTTDSIIRKAGISKGSLYEYTDSKRELYLFILNHVYTRLYSFIQDRLKTEYPYGISDILERVRAVSCIAADFYIAYPSYIRVIEKTGKVNDSALAARAEDIFIVHYSEIFGEFDSSRLRTDRKKLLDLLVMFLIETRRTFLDRLDNQTEVSSIKNDYLRTWEFYLDILRNGIYAG